MAEGFAGLFAKGIFESYSAGSKPSGSVNAEAINVMKEVGIDISSQKSKGFNDLNIKEFDAVVTLGCGDICPFVPAQKHIEWQIDNPKGKDVIFFRMVRDKIRDRVKKLSESIAHNEIERRG